MEQQNKRPSDRHRPSVRRRTANHRRGMGCGFALLYMIVILGISIVLSIVAIFLANDVLALVKPDMDIPITVSQKTTMEDMSAKLEEEGVINYAWAFNLFTSVTKKDKDIYPGEYTLNPTMDYGQVLDAFEGTTSNETIDVAIPEGYTIDQITALLVEKGVVYEEQMEEALTTYPFKHEFLEEQLPPSDNWLEGYLFPDTYTFYLRAEPIRGVLNRMLNNFDDKYDDAIQEGAANLGLSTEEVVIIASLIEREAQKEEELAMVSGVIHNRLNNADVFPYLQIDAALLYAVGQKEALTQADLELDSPYNLYKTKGLPPTPICNPGYAALYAATHPEAHNYFYYVAMPDGSHLFSNSYEEHKVNIETARVATEKAKADAEAAEQTTTQE